MGNQIVWSWVTETTIEMIEIGILCLNVSNAFQVLDTPSLEPSVVPQVQGSPDVEKNTSTEPKAILF